MSVCEKATTNLLCARTPTKHKLQIFNSQALVFGFFTVSRFAGLRRQEFKGTQFILLTKAE